MDPGQHPSIDSLLCTPKEIDSAFPLPDANRRLYLFAGALVSPSLFACNEYVVLVQHTSSKINDWRVQITCMYLKLFGRKNQKSVPIDSPCTYLFQVTLESPRLKS